MRFFAVISLLLLAACGGPRSSTPEPETETLVNLKLATPPSGGSIFGGHGTACYNLDEVCWYTVRFGVGVENLTGTPVRVQSRLFTVQFADGSVYPLEFENGTEDCSLQELLTLGEQKWCDLEIEVDKRNASYKRTSEILPATIFFNDDLSGASSTIKAH